ncbi:MAG: outer membrane receptor for ferrienterochelin and colicins [Candidatus Deianiraeaceae bacterium]|jgi:outer membrane receptor for ferrienterochelin and colicins
MLYIILSFITLFAFAQEDTVLVEVIKNTKMPIGLSTAHNANHVLYNEEFIKSRPQAQNVLEALEGNNSIEYQKNLQDFGGHSGVSINQLPFYYTSIFIDDIFIPANFLDASQLFSTASTQAVEVKKGAGSTSTNPSSLSGAVHIKTLNTLQNSQSIRATGGQYGYFNGDFSITKKVDERSGFLLSASSNGQSHIDNNNDNIAESPKTRNFHSVIAHQLKQNDLQIKTRIDISKNKRSGGSTIVNKNNTTGNPFNFINAGSPINNGWKTNTGSTNIYHEGTVGMLEIIESTRISLLSSINSDKFTGGGVISFLQRDNFYAGNEYKADETNIFLTGAKKISSNNIHFKIGGDFQFQNLKSQINYQGNSNTGNNPDGYSYTNIALFANAKHTNKKWISDISTRINYHNHFNNNSVLRGKIGYIHNNNITSTISAGNSYFMPGSSFEQNHELIHEQISILERKVQKQTSVINASYNTAFAYDKLQINMNYNFNEIKNIAALEVESNVGSFKNLNGKYTIHGIGLDASYFITPSLLWHSSAERYWHNLSNIEHGYVILSRPIYKLFTSLTKNFHKHQIRLKGTYFGKQNLEEFYGKIYDLSGSQNPKFSNNFLIMDLDYNVKLYKNFTIFAGVENILNYIQVKHSSPIAQREGHAGELDNINTWGPVRGRFFYIGFQKTIH